MPPPCFSSSCYLKAECLRPRRRPAGHLYSILEVSLIHARPVLRLVKPSTQPPGPGLGRCSWIFNAPIVLVFEWVGTTGWVGTLSGQLGSDVATRTAGGQGQVGDQQWLSLTCCTEALRSHFSNSCQKTKMPVQREIISAQLTPTDLFVINFCCFDVRVWSQVPMLSNSVALVS